MKSRYLKKLLLFIFIVIPIICFAQVENSKVVVINYYKFNFPDEVAVPEFDSLLNEYKKNVLARNEYILNFSTMRHWWGNRDKDFLIMYEVKNWDDVIKASQRNNQLFEEKWDTAEEREKFNTAFNKYFTAKYPDEIYRKYDGE